MVRRNSNGKVLPPASYDPRSYDDRQIAMPLEPMAVVESPDTLDHRIEVFLNRWHWRGPRDVVKRELEALIAEAGR